MIIAFFKLILFINLIIGIVKKYIINNTDKNHDRGLKFNASFLKQLCTNVKFNKNLYINCFKSKVLTQSHIIIILNINVIKYIGYNLFIFLIPKL